MKRIKFLALAFGLFLSSCGTIVKVNGVKLPRERAPITSNDIAVYMGGFILGYYIGETYVKPKFNR